MRKPTTLCYRNGSFPGTGKHLFNQVTLTLPWKQKLFPHMHHSRELSSADKQHDIRYFIATSPICPLDWIFFVFLTLKRCFVENNTREQEVSKVTGITSHLQVLPYMENIASSLQNLLHSFLPFWRTKSFKGLAFVLHRRRHQT